MTDHLVYLARVYLTGWEIDLIARDPDRAIPAINASHKGGGSNGLRWRTVPTGVEGTWYDHDDTDTHLLTWGSLATIVHTQAAARPDELAAIRRILRWQREHDIRGTMAPFVPATRATPATTTLAALRWRYYDGPRAEVSARLARLAREALATFWTPPPTTPPPAADPTRVGEQLDLLTMIGA